MFRILLFFILVAISITLTIFVLDLILGHRILIPLAKILKFKIDDTKHTEKKVKEILGEKNGQRKDKKRKNKQ